MIRRRRSPHCIALATAWLALAGVRARAMEETEKHAPEEHHTPPAETHATEEASAKVEAAKPAKEEQHDAPAKAEPAKPAAAHSTASEPKARPKPFARLNATAVEGLLKLGASLTGRSDYDSAEVAYHQVLDGKGVADEDLKTALLGLAQMHRRQGALTKAAAIYERYLKDYPGDDRTPEALLNLGRTLRSLGVYKLAIARFYSVINSTLKLPGEGFERYQVLAKTAQFEIAETHFQAGDFAEATKFYTRLRLLDLAPADRARAHFKAAYSLRLQGELESSVATLRAYIEQWPDDENVPEARYLLAITLRELKRPQEAFTAALELLRMEKSRVASDPKRWVYWQRRTGNQLANDFFETGDTLNARAIYASLLELSPEPGWRLPISYQLALCDERLGASERALAGFRSIVETAGATPPPELAELVKMAAWRIEHLAWREKVGQQVTSFFETTTGKQATSAAPLAASTQTAATP